jgi:glycosyltransferase involved in cell wall biosynthesis
MPTYPKISVVTTNYNYGHFLEETIDSVLSQNYPNLEYIITDGGSSDSSVEVIKKYESHLAYWISEPDRGQANGINKGFRKCTGEIIAFLNSDDLYQADTLQTVAQCFSQNSEVQWIGSPIDIVDEHGKYLKSCPVSPFRRNVNWLEGLWFPQPSSFWHRDLMEQVGLLDESLYFCFDQEYWARFACAGHQPLILEKPLSVEREHEARKTSNHSEKYLLERLYIAEKYMSCLSAKESREVRDSIRHFERRLIRQPIYDLADSSRKKALGMLGSRLLYHSDLLKDRETWGLLKTLITN